jgi:hypothetical protein
MARRTLLLGFRRFSEAGWLVPTPYRLSGGFARMWPGSGTLAWVR